MIICEKLFKATPGDMFVKFIVALLAFYSCLEKLKKRNCSYCTICQIPYLRIKMQDLHCFFEI